MAVRTRVESMGLFKVILIIGAVACGVVLGVHMPTGDVDANQVAGIGIICAALAQVV